MIDELIAKLGQADGPGPDLDAEIAVAIGWERHEENGYVWAVCPKTGVATDTIIGPKWTSSIDSALTLLPESWTELESRTTRDGGTTYVLRFRINEDYGSVTDGHHKTPAIALCIAELKARKEVGQ